VIRVNPYGLPIITSLFSKAYQTIEAKYYGYLNSDILLQPTVFEVLHYCMNQTEQGVLAREVSIELILHFVAWTRWSCIWTGFQRYSYQIHFIESTIGIFHELFSSSTSSSESRKCCSPIKKNWFVGLFHFLSSCNEERHECGTENCYWKDASRQLLDGLCMEKWEF